VVKCNSSRKKTMKTEEYTPNTNDARASNSNQNRKAIITRIAANRVDKKYAAEPTQNNSKHRNTANQKNKNSNVILEQNRGLTLKRDQSYVD